MEQDGRPMELERAPGANGRDAPGDAPRDPRRDVPAAAVRASRDAIGRRQARVRASRLVVPAMLALGVIFILRRLEQDTTA